MYDTKRRVGSIRFFSAQRTTWFFLCKFYRLLRGCSRKIEFEKKSKKRETKFYVDVANLYRL